MSQISLTFPDGAIRDYAAGVTAAEVAASISPGLAKKAISATVNGAHWDLQWPITANASISIHTMQDNPQALELIRHDLAHIMARAVQEIWQDVKVTIGPVRDYGWFYDFDRAEPFTPEDLGLIEARMKQIINARDPVRTEVLSRADAIRFCADLRAARPDFAFGADFIAGFPTETEAQFANTLDLVEECGLAFLHVFPFSPRPGTPAARMPQLPRPLVKERAARLRATGAAALIRHLDGHIGREGRILAERGGMARLDDFTPVRLSTPLEAGTLAKARITGHDGVVLLGEVTDR